MPDLEIEETTTEIHPRKKVSRFPFYPHDKYTINKDIIVSMVVKSKVVQNFTLRAGNRILVENPQTMGKVYNLTIETLDPLISHENGQQIRWVTNKDILDEQKIT